MTSIKDLARGLVGHLDLHELQLLAIARDIRDLSGADDTTPATTRHAAALLIAAATGAAPGHALELAGQLWGLPFGRQAELAFETSGVFQSDVDPAAEVRTSCFGDAVIALIELHRLGLTPGQFEADPRMVAAGIRIGFGSDRLFARYEKLALGSADLGDRMGMVVWGLEPVFAPGGPLPAVHRTAFVAMPAIERLAELLGRPAVDGDPTALPGRVPDTGDASTADAVSDGQRGEAA